MTIRPRDVSATEVTDIDLVLRALAPGVLTALLRSSWDFETSEDAGKALKAE